MTTMLTKRLFIVVAALALALVFAAGEVAVAPETHAAYAQRKKREKREEPAAKPAEQKPAGDELDKVLGGQKDTGKIDVESLKIPDDVPLTSSVGQKIDESIQKLFLILEKFQEPGTLRRLAEFYWKKAHRLNLDLMQEHQKKMDVWYQAGQQGEPPKEPDAEVWFKYNRKAVEICIIIMEKFPKFQGMDEVYFFMGYNLTEIGKDAEAVEYYKKLVREFPASQYVPDSWMAIGDYYFSHNNVYDALPAYEEVLKFENSKVFGYAKYKIGWCYFNLGKYRDSIETFKEVVAWSIDQEKQGGSAIELKEEALKDLVMAFAEEGSVDEAERYFLEVGGKQYFRMMLVRLAEIYTNQGKLDDSIVIYRRLIRDYPLHKENPDFQVKIVEAYSNKNDKENTTKEIINMVYYAKPDSESEWVKANQEKEPETVEEAWENAERMLIKTVVEYHKEAIKVTSEETWDKAQQLYEIYLQYFSKSKTYYDVNFNYAELLFARGLYDKAGEWYTKVAEMDRKGKHFEEASYAAILSYEKLVHKEIEQWIGDTKKRSQRSDKSYKLAVTKEAEQKEQAQREAYDEVRPMSPNVQGFVKACNIYIDNIPESKYKVDIIYKVAIISYAHYDFDNAVSRFELIVKDYPTHRLAEYAANLILDSLNIKGRWRKLNETTRGYLKNQRLVQRKAFRNDLVDLLEKSTFKMVEESESEKNWQRAGDEYMAFAKEFPKSTMRDKALYNASVHYVTAGEIEKSIVVQKQFLKEYDKSPLAPKILFNLGKNYEALAYYSEAATVYEDYTKKYAKGEDVKDATFNASVFHENLGNTEKAVQLKLAYANLVDNPSEKDDAVYSIGFVYVDAKDYKNAEKQFKAYLTGREKDIAWPKQDKKTGEFLSRGKIKGDANRVFAAHIALLDIYRKENRQTDIDQSRQTVLKLAHCDVDGQLGEPAREAIAEASFFALQPAFHEYAEYKLEVRKMVDKEKWNALMAERLKGKSERVVRLQKAYEEIIALKSPQWSVAALYQIGQVYKQFSLALFNSETPYWLDEDQQVIYVEAIQRRAVPVEQKAIEGFEKCLETAFRTGVYNSFTTKAREELQGYAPKAYKMRNEIAFAPRFESDSFYGGAMETPEVPDIPEPKRGSQLPAGGQPGSPDGSANEPAPEMEIPSEG
ncbi:MAG: hypothetical protein C4523_06580 [Myxococcales bacterium]|nr:MAG: hypothetical protein C4523_06580 [Myxococcales bacterium]